MSTPSFIPAEESLVSIDFTQRWELSDVALKAKDRDELLYANKVVLAVHSVYFKDMFFSGFAEVQQGILEVDITYWAMLEILKLLHHVDRHFGGGMDVSPLPVDKYVELQKAGDRYEIPLVRQYARHLFSLFAPEDGLDACIKLGFDEYKTELLKRMSYKDIDTYLKKETPGLAFSSADAAILLQKGREPKKETLRPCSSERKTRKRTCD